MKGKKEKEDKRAHVRVFVLRTRGSIDHEMREITISHKFLELIRLTFVKVQFRQRIGPIFVYPKRHVFVYRDFTKLMKKVD